MLYNLGWTKNDSRQDFPPRCHQKEQRTRSQTKAASVGAAILQVRYRAVL